MYFVGSSVDTIYDEISACEQQVDQAQALGVNLLRWQIIQGVKEPKPQAYGDYINFVYWSLDKYDKCRERIKAAGMKVVIVMMHPFGGYSGHRMNLFMSMRKLSENLAGFKKCWEYIANRYKDDEVIEGFELLNEPQVVTTRGYLANMQPVVTALRKITNKTLIINCPGTTPEGFKLMKPLLGENLYYGFHYYAPNSITHQRAEVGLTYFPDPARIENDLRYVLKFRQTYALPVVNTEFGCTSLYPVNQEKYIKTVMSVFKNLGISYVYHNVSDVKDNVWQLVGGAKKSFLEKATDFLKTYN